MFRHQARFHFSFFEVSRSALRRFTHAKPGAQRAGRAGQINQGPKAFELFTA
jgi:hypothetical protein